ncbi:H/ACA ribonucleoprotein complex subunit GAR1-like [Rhodamnia argentea]|uniref:H/ACA ribonucleoprotein complex subunit GAR1-like n=1 Tax=Rhodamnia argentea TaxID=178133 RepID=A0ABM3HJ44_9MYRT|nr:H/ACA ribonucleoprotein complex subunit GAR1-like [Rhodamnia argentea]
MTRVCDTWEAPFDLQRGSQSLSEHYARFTTLCRQLDTYLPASNDPVVLVKRQEDLRVILYLKTLGFEYFSFRQQITSQSSLPTVDETFSQALCSTPAEKITSVVETSAMISHGTNVRGAHGRGFRGRGRSFTPSGGRGGRDGGAGARGATIFGGGRGSRFCTHCQRAGHI